MHVLGLKPFMLSIQLSSVFLNDPDLVMETSGDEQGAVVRAQVIKLARSERNFLPTLSNIKLTYL
jgi:hypothetical protein